ncbi:peptidase C39 family protein [Demequina sp. NBRC 110054]|uniref:peptidase C39 family protein n=1 Tax=Demequina sp. NBRC 110054 TaxID=1570343 RepID=UPI000A02F16A|nr:peptidase C39 family protein [Demequina sp. NBRC 110054]
MSPSTTLVTGLPAVMEALDADLATALGADRADRWRIDRSAYEPTIRVRGEAPRAAVLTSARPATAATKIVDLWWDDEAEAVALLEEVIAAAMERGDAVVKWETAPGTELPGFAAARGFSALRRPWSAKGTEVYGGHALWLRHLPHHEPGYYAQTTMFTCGAVAALIASEELGSAGFHGDDGDRDHEVDFWRRASNYPACEPVGLAVAIREDLRTVPVAVSLDVDGPVLLEGFEGFDRDFRAELQEQSWGKAEALGVPVSRSRVTVEQIAARVADGEIALLLIDEHPMHGTHGPHWIVAHASDGDVVVVEDPWTESEHGETWVDTHDLPVALADLDRLVTWGDDGYRGVIFLGRG